MPSAWWGKKCILGEPIHLQCRHDLICTIEKKIGVTVSKTEIENETIKEKSQNILKKAEPKKENLNKEKLKTEKK